MYSSGSTVGKSLLVFCYCLVLGMESFRSSSTPMFNNTFNPCDLRSALLKCCPALWPPLAHHSKTSDSLDLGVNEKYVDEECSVFPGIRGEDLENDVTVCQRRCSDMHRNSRIPNYNLRTFLKKVSGIFPFGSDSMFLFKHFLPRKSYRWYIYFMND